jgi:hypothetical protein
MAYAVGIKQNPIGTTGKNFSAEALSLEGSSGDINNSSCSVRSIPNLHRGFKIRMEGHERFKFHKIRLSFTGKKIKKPPKDIGPLEAFIQSRFGFSYSRLPQ